MKDEKKSTNDEMTELKTLKDFNFYDRIDNDNYPFVEIELRAEAVKWVKKFEEEKNWSGGKLEMIWIKMFFNLTEEDLQ